MQVSDIFVEITEKDQVLGIYAEVIGHLEQFLDDEQDLQIPKEGSATEYVEPVYVESFLAGLKADQARIRGEKEDLLSWRVEPPTEDADAEDDDGAGAGG